jgi:lipid-A-disaccharide synthase
MLPGSRQSELEYHAELFIDAASCCCAIFQAKFLVPLTTRETREQFDRRAGNLARRTCHPGAVRPCQFCPGGGVALVAAAPPRWRYPAALSSRDRLSSFGHHLSPDEKGAFAVCRSAEHPGWEWLVPELLQDDATPENLACALGNWIRHQDGQRLARTFRRYSCGIGSNNGERVREVLRPLLARARRHAGQHGGLRHAVRVLWRR